jgi:hypothetical protein
MEQQKCWTVPLILPLMFPETNFDKKEIDKCKMFSHPRKNTVKTLFLKSQKVRVIGSGSGSTS